MISQGQQQLLTIARTILPNPKVMILDEAISNIDTKTEKDIQAVISQLMKFDGIYANLYNTQFNQ
ncbi:hypothetical protein HMPREF1539_02063 [Fusobacterium nucleatum CTI-2]|nr:hypothetical protein HMPREF1539_02063 [Fusobacterium nucleatum CTI-2]